MTHTACIAPTPIGELRLVASETGLREIHFPGRPHAPTELGETPVLDATRVQLAEYFAGTRTTFELPLELEGTPFQRQAWLALAGIPYGTTVSYAEQARRLGRPRAVRAVGAANGHNPIPIVLPCHRVVGSDGSLTGFGGGLGVKRALLEHEGALLAVRG